MSDRPIQLRPYQQDALERIEAAFKDHEGVIYCAPTGSGKTVVGTAGIPQLIEKAHRILFVCHRVEILDQTSLMLERLRVPHGKIAAGYDIDDALPVQIAMVGSLAARWDNLDPHLLIFDEAHHIGAPSWRVISNRFPKAKRLGLTATPQRLDRRPLFPMFTEIIMGPSHHELREAGYLSDYEYFAPEEEGFRTALAKIRTTDDDYNKKQLGKLMSGKIVLGDTIEHFKKLPGKRSALAFCVTTKASEALVARFNADGIPARHIDAETPIKERKDAVHALATGQIGVLSNVEIFTEGLDVPAIDTLILMRPTHSVRLYLQMVGRGMRPTGKIVQVLDHAALVYEHDLPDIDRRWNLTGAAPARTGIRKPLRRCPQCDCIHEVAGICPHCRYAYPTIDRSIEEADGTLIVIKEATYPARSQRPYEPAPEGMVTVAEYAEYKGVTEETVKKWIKHGGPIH